MVDIHEVAPYHPDADRFAYEPTFVQARVGHGSHDVVMVQFAEELIQRALSRHGDELRFSLLSLALLLIHGVRFVRVRTVHHWASSTFDKQFAS